LRPLQNIRQELTLYSDEMQQKIEHDEMAKEEPQKATGTA
jgi:hypothetical protein